MGEEEDQFSTGTKFFKIMLPGFDERLKLPPAFCEKVKKEKSKRAILESSKGRWVISVRREDDQIFLEDGWPRFADEHGLSLRDFLVFEHTGKLHFNVVVCNSSGSEKQFLLESDNEHQTINPIYHTKKKAALRSESHPSFSHETSNYTATNVNSKVTIPIEFVKSNSVENKKVAILKDPQSGRKWSVKLFVNKSAAGLIQMMMSGGWHHFAAANDLEVGDVCTFQLNPTKSQSNSENIYFDVCISRNTNR